MKRVIATVLFLALSSPLAAQTQRAADFSVFLKDPAVLKTSPKLIPIGDFHFADIKKPFQLRPDVFVLDPNDRNNVLEPGQWLYVQVGEQKGTEVWLQLKLLRPPWSLDEVDTLISEPAFKTLVEYLQKSDVTTKICRPGEGTCAKTCESNGVRWCCRKRC